VLIQVDQQRFHLSLRKISLNLRSWWKEHEHDADTIEISEGRTIDFSKKSLARTAVKTALTPVAIPCLRMLYATKGAKPREFDRKNEDMFDYIVDVLMGFIAVLDDGYLYVETVGRDGSNDRYCQSISTHEPVYALTAGSTSEQEQESEVGTGRETLVYRGENWNGQDILHENIDTQET
jgi:hypothetical protein